jgi:hypothetical protein
VLQQSHNENDSNESNECAKLWDGLSAESSVVDVVDVVVDFESEVSGFMSGLFEGPKTGLASGVIIFL